MESFSLVYDSTQTNGRVQSDTDNHVFFLWFCLLEPLTVAGKLQLYFLACILCDSTEKFPVKNVLFLLRDYFYTGE